MSRPAPPPGYPPLPEPLPLPVTDSHCHLDIDPGGRSGQARLPEPEVALSLASAVNVTGVVQVGCDLDAARWAIELARAWGSVRAAVALHPTEAAQIADRGGNAGLQAALDQLAGMAADPAVVAVGETGLDHYWTPAGAGRAAQEVAFRAHVALARELGKTLVIHDRDAHEDVLRVLEDAGAPDRVVFHCFSGDAAMAARCSEAGWFCSFAGTLTFRNAPGLRAAAAAVDPRLLLVETDSPYLTPHPWRGRANAPYLVPHTVRALAEVTGRDLELTCRTLAVATERAFGPDPAAG